ncbi:homeobox-domain-containing protein [Dentipellis sp. KUC8613]|nr:homeobox-domain-containing protein [Dentipellis sp. KUC8613]
MDSKIAHLDTYSRPVTSSSRRSSTQLDPAGEDTSLLESSAGSPYSAAKSPGTPAEPSSSSAVSPEQETDAAPEPSKRRRSSKGANGEREKRKRSRVTPEQLIHLERIFTTDRSPTAARRKEISDMLGMQERQTQIWFQNRRAKAKLLDGKTKTQTADTPPNSPPELSPGFEVDLHNLLHEDEPVMIIPCSDLSIGTWRRMATTVGKHDLVAYVCEPRQCLTWFIHSSGYGFKMEIPFSTITDTEFRNAAPGQGLATFLLSQPPIFYLEEIASPMPDGAVRRTWKRCADWTEGMQASKILRHELIGSAVQLAHVLRNFNSSTSSADIQLHPPAYNMRRESPSVELTPMSAPGDISREPGYGHHYEDPLLDSPQHMLMHSRKRSFNGNPLILTPQSMDNGEYPGLPYGASNSSRVPTPSSFPFTPLSTPSTSSSAAQYSAPMYMEVQDPHRQQPSPLGQYGNVAISQQQRPGYPCPQQQSYFPPPPASAPASHARFGSSLPAGGIPSFQSRVTMERRGSAMHIDSLNPPLMLSTPPPFRDPGDPSILGPHHGGQP